MVGGCELGCDGMAELGHFVGPGLAVFLEFGRGGLTEGGDVLGGGQVAVEQVHLFVGQGFGLLLGEAAFDEVLDEPVGVDESCNGSHRATIKER